MCITFLLLQRWRQILPKLHIENCLNFVSVHSLIPEIHKLKYHVINDLSPRQIISSLRTYDFNLAKFLTTLLGTVISVTNFTGDSFSFCEKIEKVPSRHLPAQSQ